MISKNLPAFLLLFLIVIYSPSLKAQDLDLINANLLLINSQSSDCDCCNTLDINKPFYEGEIVLKDSTVLIGKISVNQPFKNKLITIFKSDDDYEPIDNGTIKEVNLSYTQNKITKEIKFLNVNEDERLYRLVFQKGNNISVYDSSDKLKDNSLVGRVLVKENNVLTDTWNFWSSGSKKDLINYLNKRDGTDYKRRDFKSLDDLFAKL
ncbi:hypothetical protein [Winogradskyella sp. MIT101101]|uniref:hypothetical protein n=1 Tax=Winogradskyella sp. MIT101101 TaxID=3098297 RepID=UPI00399A7F5D